MITRGTKSVGLFSILYFAGACVLLTVAILEVRRLGQELEEQVRLVANSEAIKQQAAESQQLLRETENERQDLNEHILTEDNMVNFLAEIEAVAKQQGVGLATKALDLKEIDDQNFDTLTASFGFAGEQEAAFRLIRIFENLPYESSVTRLTYGTQDGRIEGEISIDVSIVSYDQ